MKRRTIVAVMVVAGLVATGAFAATAIPSRDKTEARVEVKTPTKTPETPTQAVEEKAPEVKPVHVKTNRVETGTLTEYITATGTTAANTDVTFSAEVPGRIGYLGADLGDTVRKGQVLARIDFRTLKAQKNYAEVNYGLAETTHKRLDDLGAELVSRQKLDEAHSAMNGAKAQLTVAESNLAKSLLRSNIKGVVSAKFVDEAEYVGPGTPMFRVVDYSKIIIEAQLPETQVALIEEGSEVAVTVSAFRDEFRGTVETVLPTADPVSKTFTVRVEVDNPDLRILIGMSATLNIEARVHEDVVVVPQDVVIEGRGGRSVFVASDGVAVQKKVRLGATEGDRVVILEGLAAGEDMVVLGHRNLADKQPIETAP